MIPYSANWNSNKSIGIPTGIRTNQSEPNQNPNNQYLELSQHDMCTKWTITKLVVLCTPRNFRTNYQKGKMTMFAPIYFPYLALIDSCMHMHFLNRVRWLVFWDKFWILEWLIFWDWGSSSITLAQIKGKSLRSFTLNSIFSVVQKKSGTETGKRNFPLWYSENICRDY